MYTREILPPITSPVLDGKPVFGTWNRAFEKVDLKEIRKPYKSPLLNLLKDSRIKEWFYFNVQDNAYLLEAVFSNFKLYRMAQVFIYNKGSGQKSVFRKFKPPSGLQLPSSLSNSQLESNSSQFFFSIHNWLDADTVKLDINIEKSKSFSRKQPRLTAHLTYNMSAHEVTPAVVSLGFSEQRSMCAYKALAPVHGSMVFDGKQIDLKQDTCSGFFLDYRGYFPYRMMSTYCSAAGFIEENKRFGFHIAENQTKETNKNNENALWTNGKLTPLPPVHITMPNGHDADWIIQDVEGMVDLTFTPNDHNRYGSNILISNTEFITQLGVYNGMLMNSDGERFQIKNFFGMGEKNYLRV
ncbi:MAG: DUF2804 domain-containing protein [Treponema sp.]|nr:DUF2804 domain-containing protein [Treponema sp.]